MTEIQNGCVLVAMGSDGVDTFKYVDAKTAGILTIYFTAVHPDVPKIGDFINDNFQLVKRTTPKIVPDLVQPDTDDNYTYRR